MFKLVVLQIVFLTRSQTLFSNYCFQKIVSKHIVFLLKYVSNLFVCFRMCSTFVRPYCASIPNSSIASSVKPPLGNSYELYLIII